MRVPSRRSSLPHLPVPPVEHLVLTSPLFPVLPGRLARTGRRAEAAMGFVTEFLIVSLMICGCIGILAVSAGAAERVLTPLALAVAMGLLVCEAVFVCRLYDALGAADLDPFAPLFALRSRPWRPVLRPVVCCWWVAHFVIAAGLAFGAEAAVARLTAGSDRFGRWRWAVQVAGFTGAGFPFTFASNLYASLAVVAAGGGEGAVAGVWRWRLTVDVVIAVAAAVTAAVAGSPRR